MKKMRRFAAIAAAAMTACMAVPMMGMMTASAESITIEGIGTEAHTFEVYQVFTGTLENGKLTALKWGSGVSAYNGSPVTDDSAVSDTDAAAFTALTDARDVIDMVTLSTTKACEDVVSSGPSVTIDGLTAGYYIVKDITNFTDKDDANSAWIVQVATSNTTVSIKNAKPAVDKQIQDETTDAEDGATNGWGESADHAINEKFQFKLTATIPANSTNLKYYDTYKMVFQDDLSAGVTFDQIDSVTVNGQNVTYTETATTATEKAGLAWSLTIDDVIQPVKDAGGTWGTTAVEVVVTYTAHLNEEAIVSGQNVTNGGVADVENNMVYLQYSNNPDNTGGGELGKTEKDYVWAFTYKAENTKVSNTENGAKLAGAVFELTDADGNIVKLIDNEDGTYTVADQTATSGVVTELTSNSVGKFDIIGLDAGTYTLTETDAPEGYNICEPVTFTITATHKEVAGTAVNMTLNGDATPSNTIINKEGASLPSTGGIGTTLFYVIGGTLAAGAGVALIAKKRMKNEE